MWRVAGVAGLLYLLVMGLSYALGPDSAAPTFVTAPVERGAISTIVMATGTVEAVATVDISSQLSGRIADVFVNFNDAVSAGQPIAELDQEIFTARVSEASAALAVAKASEQLQRAGLTGQGSSWRMLAPLKKWRQLSLLRPGTSR